MPKACLKESMKGKVLERNKCPEGQSCTKGPKEIVKNKEEMRLWYCEKDKKKNEKPTTEESERMQGDQRQTDGAITTTVSPKKGGLLADWVCSILNVLALAKAKSLTDTWKWVFRSFHTFI